MPRGRLTPLRVNGDHNRPTARALTELLLLLRLDPRRTTGKLIPIDTIPVEVALDNTMSQLMDLLHTADGRTKGVRPPAMAVAPALVTRIRLRELEPLEVVVDVLIDGPERSTWTRTMVMIISCSASD